MTRYYAGIGSRKTPTEVLAVMTSIADRLDTLGYRLRSGGAEGADTAFYDGTMAQDADIYLPWPNFGTSGLECQGVADWAIEKAKEFHPNWDACSSGARKLHGRNTHILLGKNGDQPVDFLICWTPGGKTVGGTGQALRVAFAEGIPIFNLAVLNNARLLAMFLETLERGIVEKVNPDTAKEPYVVHACSKPVQESLI